MSLYSQAPSAVVMIRPHHFSPNQQTKQDNSFQSDTSLTEAEVSKLAFKQVTKAKEILAAEGICVHMFEDTGTMTPDSVFPNNWFSTHHDGRIAIYPMYAPNRRKERRDDIIEFLKMHYLVQEIIDYSGLANDQIFLEGTGAMVLDHNVRLAFAVRSKRTNTQLLETFCAQFNFDPVVFDAQNQYGIPVYHTNVLMCIGTEFVITGFEMIPDHKHRAEIIQFFTQAGKTIISLTEPQINAFCGNALELQGTSGRILALSATAYDALTPEQIKLLKQYVKLVPIDVSAIELAGGSIRCMLAGIHLTKR